MQEEIKRKYMRQLQEIGVSVHPLCMVIGGEFQ